MWSVCLSLLACDRLAACPESAIVSSLLQLWLQLTACEAICAISEQCK